VSPVCLQNEQTRRKPTADKVTRVTINERSDVKGRIPVGVTEYSTRYHPGNALKILKGSHVLVRSHTHNNGGMTCKRKACSSYKGWLTYLLHTYWLKLVASRLLLLDSVDQVLFRVNRAQSSPCTSSTSLPSKRTIYNIYENYIHGLTIPRVSSSLMSKTS